MSYERAAHRVADALAGIARSYLRQATALERIAAVMEAANQPEAMRPPPTPIDLRPGARPGETIELRDCTDG